MSHNSLHVMTNSSSSVLLSIHMITQFCTSAPDREMDYGSQPILARPGRKSQVSQMQVISRPIYRFETSLLYPQQAATSLIHLIRPG